MKRLFNLQYDMILLATASAAHMDLPFLLPYRKEMDRCRNGTSCQQISQTIEALGKLWKTCYDLSFPDPSIQELSLHPAHLINGQGQPLPSALVPFCSYQSTMMGRELEGFVACDKFQPTVLEGQMCYSLDLKDMKKSAPGKSNGLSMILDANTIGNEEENVAKIYIHTLSPFSEYKNGSYGLFSLTKITGTSGFLSIPDADKKCQVEAFEECNTRRYLQRVHIKCKCAPWALGDTYKV